MNKRLEIIKSIELDEAILSLRNDGIIHVFFKDNTELDVVLQEKLLIYYEKLTGGIKTPFIFEAGANCNVTKEARENAVRLEKISPMSACTVIVDNTAYMLIANFYYKFNKPTIPYKVFKNREDGVKWLKSLDSYQPHKILNKIE